MAKTAFVGMSNSAAGRRALLLLVAFLLTGMQVGCGGYELHTERFERPDVRPGARILVFPLSPVPEVVTFPGAAMDRFYGKLETAGIPPRAQAKQDVDFVWRGYAGSLIAGQIVEALRAGKNGLTITYALDDGDLRAEYNNATGGSAWVAPGTKRDPTGSYRNVLPLWGLTPEPLAGRYDADILIWGDVSVVQPRELAARIVVYDRQGKPLWLCCVSSHAAAFGRDKTFVAATLMFLPELADAFGIPGAQPPDWINDVVGQLQDLLGKPPNQQRVSIGERSGRGG